MNKLDFFLFLLNEGLLKYRSIILSLFTIIESDMDNVEFDRGRIKRSEPIVYTIDSIDYPISFWKKNEPLYGYKESVLVKKGSVINIDTDVETTYGRLLANQLLLVENIGDKIKYQNGNWIKDGILNSIMDTIAKDDDIGAEKSHQFIDSLQFVSSLTQICVPSASERSMSTDPKIAQRKKELLAKYRDQLGDPAILSQIEQELIAMDKQWIKGDVSEGFYKSGKDFNVSRKRMFIMHGGEKSFVDDSKIELIEFSLDESWNLKELPKVSNSLRDGSFGRGSATAMGGERVKKFQQTFQNSRISMKDCKTNRGGRFYITQYNKKDFINRYLVNGKKIDESIINKHINRYLEIRSPIYCKAPKTDYCELCTGLSMSTNPNAVNMLVASIGSVFMSIEMKSTHGKELLVSEFDIDNCIF